MLRLCDTCNCRGFIGPAGFGGPCPTCDGSGFANATGAEARDAELAESRGEPFVLPPMADSTAIRQLLAENEVLEERLYDALEVEA